MLSVNRHPVDARDEMNVESHSEAPEALRMGIETAVLSQNSEMTLLSQPAVFVNGSMPIVNGFAPIVNDFSSNVNGFAPIVNGFAPNANGSAPIMNGLLPNTDKERNDGSNEMERAHVGKCNRKDESVSSDGARTSLDRNYASASQDLIPCEENQFPKEHRDLEEGGACIAERGQRLQEVGSEDTHLVVWPSDRSCESDHKNRPRGNIYKNGYMIGEPHKIKPPRISRFCL